ncbi:SPL family radical SAM protein [Clostridium sp. LBM24168]
MSSLKNNLQFSSFSHIYVENRAFENENTKKILSNFKNSKVIVINHYKNVFCRKNQDFFLQKCHPNLILAIKKGTLIYKGAKVCENFGNKYFYYTSSIMNCIYNCEYCYLQGMYSSANIVVFVNLQDTFMEVENILKKHPLYLCISYDTDILAFENILGFSEKWIEFTRKHKNLIIEIRTKSANFRSIENLQPCENVILAWTFSPDEISRRYESGAPAFKSRLKSVKAAISRGWKVRLCFDPILYVKNWKKYYNECIRCVFDNISPLEVYDVSIGMFRISKNYIKNMKRVNPLSEILAYPFRIDNGVYTYTKSHCTEMIDFIYNILTEYLEKEKIYI